MTGRLVVGVDTESAAAVAAEWAGARAARTGESITLVTTTAFAVPPPGTLEALDSAHRALTEELGEGRVEQRLVTEAPSITEALIEEAGEDVLVIGHHRTRALRSALRGWLPLDIALQAVGPVIIVPDDHRPGRGERIVAGLERDGSAAAALAFAMRQADLLGLPALIVAAERVSHAGSALDLEEVIEELRSENPEVDVAPVLAEGAAAPAIIAEARRAALVVIGRHPVTPLEEVLVGATGHRLLKECTAPLCIVPPQFGVAG